MSAKRLMYHFVSDKRPNPLGGGCYDCEFCYIHGKKGMIIRFPAMKRKYTGDFKLYPKMCSRLNNIRDNKPVFFCDCIDWLHEDNTEENINEILVDIEGNRYHTDFLSLTKNPKGYFKIMPIIPDNLIVGISIDSNRDYQYKSNAPSNSERIKYALRLRDCLDSIGKSNKIFISIEPINDFDLIRFFESILKIKPNFGVAIGYDNHHNKLDEPSLRKTLALRNNLISRDIKIYDKTLRKAWWEK